MQCPGGWHGFPLIQNGQEPCSVVRLDGEEVEPKSSSMRVALFPVRSSSVEAVDLREDREKEGAWRS